MRVVRLLGVGALERVTAVLDEVVHEPVELGAALAVDPAHDLPHPAAGARGCVQERGESLLGGL